jgi:hypothetical protein
MSNLRRYFILSSSPPGLFLTFTLWALILTYPLPLHLASHIPLGSEPVGVVPLFNLWSLQWNIDQLMQGYPNYWDAPIFAPHKGVFAFSEAQPVSALLAAPFWVGGQSPALGYNGVVLLFLSLNGWFGYWLMKDWGGSAPVALLTGLVIQALPFVAQEMGVLQLIAIFGLLWSLLFLSRFMLQSRRGIEHWPTLIALALGTPVTFFTCGYYGLFGLLFLPLAFLVQLRKEDLNLKQLRLLLVVGTLIFVLTGPFLWTQQQHLAQYGFVRSDKTIADNSARLSDYINFLDYNIFYGQILEWPAGRRQRLFPGFGLIVLAGLGFFGRSQRRIKLYLGLAVTLSLILSMGLRFQLGDIQPYAWIRAYLPGFAQLRSPFRFAALAQLHLALLAGFGLLNLEQWLGKRGTFTTFAAVSVVLVEALALPLPLQPVPALPQNAAWQAWLNQHQPPPRIIMLPFAATNRVADFEQTVYWMLESRYFRGYLLNGYSGFFPQDHAQLRAYMLEFPSQAGLDLLRDLQVDYVIIHHHLAGAPSPETVMANLPIVYQDSLNQVSIYTLPN